MYLLAERFSVVITLLLITHSVLAQSPNKATAEVHGQIRFASGGAHAENVLVRLERFDGGVVAQMVTDRTGKFRFAGLQRIQYVLTVRSQGHKEERRQVDLQTITSDYLFLQLVADKQPTATEYTALIDAKVPAEARKEFEQAQEALLKSKKIQDGIRHLEKAIDIYPAFIEAQLLLGSAYMEDHQWKKAEQTLTRALEITQKKAVALFALGEVYRRQKRYAEAEKMLREGIRLEGRSPQGYFELGRVYWDKGEIEKAGPQVGRAIQLKPDFAEAHLLAGNILLRAKQPENALVEFEVYLRLAPDAEFSGQAREVVQKIKQALATKKK